MNPIQGEILFRLFQQVNERIWYYDAATDSICYVASDGSTEEAIPFDEHMAMKHPDDCQQVYESLDYMMKNHKPYPQPLMIRYKDAGQPDGYRYTLNAIVPEFEGDIIRVIGSEQDITSMVRKQQLAEQQTKMIEELLRNRNEDTWTISRETEMIHITKQDGTIDKVKIDELQKTIDMSGSENAVEALEAFRRGDTKVLEFNLLEKEKGSRGYRRYLKCTSMPSKYDYRGNVLEYIGVSTDITKDVKDKQRLTEALEEAKEQSRKKSVFVARASHDIRNPLNVMLSLSEMMCMDMPVEEREELSAMMKQSGEALHTLINDILDLTRIESGTMQLVKEEFEIKPLIETIISSFDLQTSNSHTIKLKADVEQPIVKSDSKRLTQIVDNYLSNAIKYSPEGSEIEIALKNSDSEGLFISVKDQGCGISDNDKQRVFDEFARFNTEVTGTGLGLSICKRIAEGLGGTVGFESKLGEGSTFWVKI